VNPAERPSGIGLWSRQAHLPDQPESPDVDGSVNLGRTTPDADRSIVRGVRDGAAACRLLDVGLAVLIGAVGVAEVWVPFQSVLGAGSKSLSTVVVVLVSAVLVFRRSWPLGTAVVALAVWPLIFTITPVLVLFWGQFVPMTVAVFSVARHGKGREPAYGALAGAAALLFMDLRVDVLQDASEIVFHWMVFTTAWSFGWALRVMEQRAGASTQRAIDVEVAAAERTRDATWRSAPGSRASCTTWLRMR